MKMFFSYLVAGFIFLLSATVSTVANAHGFQVGEVTVKHPYAMPSAPGSKNGAAYLKHIKNSGKVADQLVSVRTTIANKAEIHEMKMDGDVMKMRAISGIDIPPGAEVSVAKGNAKGFHLMLLGLKKPLKDGDKFAMWLTFKRAGEVEVEVWVQSPADADKPEQSQEHKH
jgi:hypothetical protein